jgi:uncharacterized repeat protein (TIGR04138 family)
VIDLDLLLYADLVVDTPELKVPHPLMHERDFVLKPLAAIAPRAVHPVLDRTVGDLLKEFGRAPDDSTDFLRDHNLPCKQCGYNLRGLTVAHVCPECGAPVIETLKDAAQDPLRGGRKEAAAYLRLTLAPVAEQSRTTVDGILFVLDAMNLASQPARGHLTASDVCRAVHEYVHVYFNDVSEARELLSEWKITASEDVGRIVFAMVDAGLMRVAPEDSVQDFDGLFTLDTLLVAPKDA